MLMGEVVVVVGDLHDTLVHLHCDSQSGDLVFLLLWWWWLWYWWWWLW